jgi:hypothetical protein
MPFVRMAASAVLLAGLVGCTNTSLGRAEPASNAFPDPSDYPVVDANALVRPDDGRFAGIAFVTSQGQRCSSNSRDYLHRIWCYGPRFDADGYWKTTVGPEQVATVEPAGPPEAASDSPALPNGHRIEFASGSLCLAAQDLFACQTDAHGFVFTSAGARLF